MYQAIELYVDVQKPTYVWGFIYVLYVYTREKGNFTTKKGKEMMIWEKFQMMLLRASSKQTLDVL